VGELLLYTANSAALAARSVHLDADVALIQRAALAIADEVCSVGGGGGGTSILFVRSHAREVGPILDLDVFFVSSFVFRLSCLTLLSLFDPVLYHLSGPKPRT